VSRMLEDGRAVARGWVSGGQRIGISQGIRVRGAAAGAVEAGSQQPGRRSGAAAAAGGWVSVFLDKTVTSIGHT
jgi:hypothetical protein